MYPKQFNLAILLCTLTAATQAQQTYNWNDSPSNYNSTNGVFDNQGNRIGYETKSPEGVTNIFDNNGNRLGYVPIGQKN